MTHTITNSPTRTAILIIALLLSIFAGFASLVSAQSGAASAGVTTSQPQICVVPWHNLYVGLRDGSENNVTSLQDFLAEQGYFTSSFRGYFGPMTMRAVMHFQSDNGIRATGYFGSMSRAHLMERFCNTLPPVRAVQLQSASPTTGAVGTTVTLSGTGFTSDNTILFGYGVVRHVSSSNGTSVTFTVPSSLEPLCRFSTPACMVLARQTVPGTYPVSVQNTNGTSNAVNFTVTGGGTLMEKPVTIYSINPTQGPTGTTVTISGSGFTSDNTIHFGNGVVMHLSSSNGKSLIFTVPSSIEPACRFSSPACMVPTQETVPGTYAVSVQNNNGTSNALNFTVTGGTLTEKPVTIYSINPTQGPVGTTITVSGSGFTSNNTVHFGNGVVMHVSSSNGKSLTFTVPSSIEPACRFSTPECMFPTQETAPGTYAVSIQNTNGTSNALNFTVTRGGTN